MPMGQSPVGGLALAENVYHSGPADADKARRRVEPGLRPAAAQPPCSPTGRTVTRSLVMLTSQSRSQLGQRNQACCFEAISDPAPPRIREGTRLPFHSQSG